ncbi:M50 family metallopeptidase [Bacillus sp. Marseille-P3661]|uniref:M50 family metallopeptidase n=1 Tax=Bacillus sp. Marseille-P3661 TaxID=1936234 RepID=UPI000C818126|nr:M50 family metallopeptidase [Bacillus sp. Marseille-P3661]
MNNIFAKLSIHPLFWLVVGFGIMTGRFLEVIMLFFIVFIHEMGHAVAAHFFHWRIKKIQILPFGGVAEMDEHGNRPLKEELIVILSGPVQHIWLIGLAYLLLSIGMIDQGTFDLFLRHNLIILAFNLLPVWPLDGGKLLFLALSYKYPFGTAHQYALYASLSMVGLLVLLTLIIYPYHLNLWLVLSFVVFTHYVEWKQRKFAHMRFLLERYYGRSIEINQLKPINVKETDQIVDVFAKFCRGCKHQIVLKLSDRDQITFDENELLHAYFAEKRASGTIGEVIGI